MEKEAKIISPSLFKEGEDWKDFYLEIKELKKGDIFYECTSHGENYELKALEDAKKIRNGWICKVQTSEKEIMEFYVSANTSYVGPNLFRAPQHLSMLENGQYAYIIK